MTVTTRRSTAAWAAARERAAAGMRAQFRCPISCMLMDDPVVLAGSGHSYDRASIEGWIGSAVAEGRPVRCPISNRTLTTRSDKMLIPNHTLASAIRQWRKRFRPKHRRGKDQRKRKARHCITCKSTACSGRFRRLKCVLLK